MLYLTGAILQFTVQSIENYGNL